MTDFSLSAAENRAHELSSWDARLAIIAEVESLTEMIGARDEEIRVLTESENAREVVLEAKVDRLTAKLAERDATITRLEAELAVADGAWHSVWLHGRWRWLTEKMTTEEKAVAADAVERHWVAMEAADGEATHEASRLALRWWDTEQCHCGHRQEQHRALYGGWTVAELIDPFGGRCKDCDCARYRLTYVAPVLGPQVDAPCCRDHGPVCDLIEDRGCCGQCPRWHKADAHAGQTDRDGGE